MTLAKLVSVIIPVWRDEHALTVSLQRLHDTPDVELIVASALGEESRYDVLRERYQNVRWVSAPRGRAQQMNAGAALARGRWLLFLHADSQLPAEWLDAIAEADDSVDIVAGAFRLALDSRDWRARVIEAGVRLRVALFGLPYGDQALFVRCRTFESIGGYRDLPLMEDVDLVRRLKHSGRLMQSRAAILTSARRWERNGWMRQSARNVSLAVRYTLGAPPARLAQRYFRRRGQALVMMARAPWTGGKTRLGVASDEAQHAALRSALFLDTLDVVMSTAGVEHVVACEPVDASERMREFVGPAIDVIAQRGGTLGERLTHVFEDVFRLGAQSVVVVGSDLPDLPVHFVERAFAALHGGKDRIVLGPAADGGYYLVGMNRPHPALFFEIDWSTDRVLAQTLRAACAQSVDVRMLDQWRDVDDAQALESVLHRSPSVAHRTRAWLEQRRSAAGGSGVPAPAPRTAV